MTLPHAIARRRPHRQRQVGAGPGARRAPPRHHHQRRLHAGVSRTARPHRPPDAGRRKPACPTASTASVPPREPGSVAWWRAEALAAMEQAAHGQGRLPILTGGTGLYFAALTAGPRRHPRPRPAGPRRGPRAARPNSAPRHCTPASPRRTPPPPPACTPTTASASPAPGRCGAAPAPASPPGRRSAARPPPWRFTAILLDPPRDELRAAIAAPLRRHAGSTARWTRCAPCWRRASTPPCRPCARTACRSCPPICAARSPWHEAGRRTELVTGQYTKRQATWFRHHRSGRPRSHTIHARLCRASTQLSERNLAEIIAFIQAPG